MKPENSLITKLNNSFLFIIIIFFIIIIARDFLYPITLGLLLSYLLYPVAQFMEYRLKIPRIIAILLTIILAIFLISFIINTLYNQLRIITSDFPVIKAHVIRKLELLKEFITSTFGVSPQNQDLYLKNTITKFFDQGANNVTKIFATTTGTIVRIVLLPVYVFFMLYYRNKAEEFLNRITPEHNRDKMQKIKNDITQVTTNYMGGVVIVVFILAILNSLGLYIIGMRYAIFFGIVAAICNIIPYFGTIVGFGIVFIFSLLLSTSANTSLLVIILFFIIQFTENNILTPNIVGSNVQLNPFIIILSLIAGAMVWGIPGMIVIIPVMAVLRIVFNNIESLKPYAYIIGVEGTEHHALTISKIKTILNRFGSFLSKWFK